MLKSMTLVHFQSVYTFLCLYEVVSWKVLMSMYISACWKYIFIVMDIHRYVYVCQCVLLWRCWSYDIWINIVPRMNASCRTWSRVMSHICMSCATHTNEWFHTYEWVMSLLWFSHFTHMNESCRTYVWVMSRALELERACARESETCHTCEFIRMTRAMNESCNTYERRYIWMVHMCDMIHS